MTILPITRAMVGAIPSNGLFGSRNKSFGSIKKAPLLLLLSAILVAEPARAFTQPVYLGTAGNFVILTASGITDVPASVIKGNVGSTPITGAAIHLTCPEVNGRIFAVNAAGPKPCSYTAPLKLSTALGDMKTAYTNAAARRANYHEIGAGNIGGLTLRPGVYNWSSGVTIYKDVTLKGSSSDVWIFQIAQNLAVASARSVILTGGAQARHVFWQVAGKVTVQTTAHLQGNILSKTLIAMKTGATIHGRLFAQTAVTLQQNVVTIP